MTNEKACKIASLIRRMIDEGIRDASSSPGDSMVGIAIWDSQVELSDLLSKEEYSGICGNKNCLGSILDGKCSVCGTIWIMSNE